METFTFPEIPVSRLLESSAKYYPKTTALVYEPENFLVNYRELCSLCERFASGLQNRLGVKKGDKVAIYSRNYPEVLIAFYGMAMAGAVYVACNPLLIKAELEYQLNDSQARIIVISDDMLPVLREIIKERRTSLETVIVFERDKEMKQRLLCKTPGKYALPFLKYSDVFSDDPPAKPKINPPSDLVGILYTSGTTSYPKGVMISHFNVVSSSIIYGTTYTGKFPELDEGGFLKFTNFAKDLSREWEYPFRYGIDSVLSVPPWTHMMGFQGQLIFPVMAAMTIFPMPAFDMDSMLEMIRRWKIAFAGGAPQMMAALLSRPDIDRQDISSIRAWTAGGNPTPVALGEKFEKRIGGVISEAWTLTEATMSSTKNYANKSSIRKFGSVGIPLPYTEVKIVDTETGTKEMPPGEEGELIQKGPSVALGYWNRREDTQAALKDGWLYTGDLGTMDENGFFYITGRKKELIKYKGYNIAPRMLEEILYKHPAVLGCAAVGKKDDVAGEIPVAFVSLKEGAKITAEELMEFVNGQVAPYKKLREIRFIEKMPLFATGKLNRRALIQML
ncbi:MAG: class I adenylate-forming enzyme family protein [Deltaproteobacteria bacterium]|nr:class I adenylate-forming enzyme family protein [Deltaproteobacteria bacterium]